MSDNNDLKFISKIKLKDNEDYYIQDLQAREDIAILSNMIAGNTLVEEPVESLEDIDPDEIVNNRIYLVKKSDDRSSKYDNYNAYIYVNNVWELLGSLDLTDYTQTTELVETILDRGLLDSIREKSTSITQHSDDNIFVGYDKVNERYIKISLTDSYKLFTNNAYIKNDDRPINALAIEDLFKDINYDIIEQKQHRDDLSINKLVCSMEFNVSYRIDKTKTLELGHYVTELDKDGNTIFIELTADNLLTYTNDQYLTNTYTKVDITDVLGVYLTDITEPKNYTIQYYLSKSDNNDYILKVLIYCLRIKDDIGIPVIIGGGNSSKLGNIKVTYR